MLLGSKSEAFKVLIPPGIPALFMHQPIMETSY